uniref:Transcription factor kk1f n=1 Tax=Curvularia clavata TaxID=95742 RepID=KK1F_CURCL|nr:RecName: Full=Transcription factor kkR; AltName: Full=KK-1 biosynthesis cluster regulator [Curvularia clavata]BBC83961.1 Basic-leucine zipper (bZIP) transcription factor [Curvularia clavata]
MTFVETVAVPDNEERPSAGHNRPVADSTKCPNAREMKVQNRVAQRTHHRRLKTKLEVLRERLKEPEKQVGEPARVQTSTSTLVSDAATSLADSMCLVPAVQNDQAMAFDFLMTPSPSVGNDCPSNDLETMRQAASVHSNTLGGAFPLNRSPCTENMTPESQVSLSTAPLCFTSVVPAELDMDAFCTLDSSDWSRPNEESLLRLANYSTSVSPTNVQWGVDENAPLQDRVRYMRDQAVAMGFGSLDDVVEAHYTQKLECTSPSFQEQRLSRNRRLSRLLSTLHNAAKDWSEWERRGLQEQVTQGAEDILVSELNSYITQRSMNSTDDKIITGGLLDEQSRLRQDVEERRRLQDSLPNLGALLTTLLSRSNAPNQDARRDTVLAMIKTMCFDQDENMSIS